ncbi:cyclic nucleotide-binding domain-containing protein [Solimonas terrae]|uniref:cyclic nucleotide-binding domain-containing protein n=1 Tax=Solimonas terrae TaxID=1396819 RepID=UPI0019D63A74
MGGNAVKVAIVGSGPAGLAAAARAAATKVSHLLLEAEPHLSNTIHRYQKGKHVMAEPDVLPLRADLPFGAGKREQILSAWADGVRDHGVSVRHQATVTAIAGRRGDFRISLSNGETIGAEFVVLAIGLQGNLRKLGCPGEDLAWVQYQLDDPDEYRGETIVVIGAGDAAIENALALASQNKVYIVNRRDEFDRAKPANNTAILKAIEDGRVQCFYDSGVDSVTDAGKGRGGVLKLSSAKGEVELKCNRVIARLGAVPPRKFVEACGVVFPSQDPNSVPAVSPQYESNVEGLYIIGALAGFPLIKQAMNQGYEVIEFIEGRAVEPADAPLLRAKFAGVSQWASDPEAALASIRRRAPVLTPLTPLQLREFLLDSEIRTPKPGDVIFRLNDYTDSFYSVVNGEVEIEIDAEHPERRLKLGQGEFFGEMSLISGRRRSATVYAGRACVLVETPRRSMNKLINSVSAVKRVIDEAFLKRALRARLTPDLTDEDIEQFTASATLVSFKASEILFNEGDPGDALYLIRRGSVMVSRQIGGREVVLAYVAAGQYVGEMALISRERRSASVRAAVAVDAIRLDGELVQAVMARRTGLREDLRAVYKDRVTQNVEGQQDSAHSGVVSFLMSQGLGEATDVLLIDESLCIRCDQCERACADTHGNVGRLDREAGPTFGDLHVPTSCRHCEHPHCMKDCPPDAIHRAPGGEVYISDACIGCGNCQRNCPYGVIQMGAESQTSPSLWRWMMFGGDEPGRWTPPKTKSGDAPAKKAAKCDMCKDQSGGPACVRACPTGAALRVDPASFLQLAREG